MLQGAIEDFAQEFALVIRRYLKLKAWRDTERVPMIGGGFRASRVGELAIGRAAVILKADKVNVDLRPIRNNPDEAGLIGCAHLAPAWMFKGHDSILAVDISRFSDFRAGVVDLNLKRANGYCPRPPYGNLNRGGTPMRTRSAGRRRSSA